MTYAAFIFNLAIQYTLFASLGEDLINENTHLFRSINNELISKPPLKSYVFVEDGDLIVPSLAQTLESARFLSAGTLQFRILQAFNDVMKNNIRDIRCMGISGYEISDYVAVLERVNLRLAQPITITIPKNLTL